MQDEINEKVIALSIRTTKLTAEMLQKSIRFMLSQIKKQLDKPVQHHGKKTLKQLMKQNAGVSSIHGFAVEGCRKGINTNPPPGRKGVRTWITLIGWNGKRDVSLMRTANALYEMN